MEKESQMVINGKTLSVGEASTVRSAIEGFAGTLTHSGLGDDAHGIAMTKGYLDNIETIRDKIYGYDY